MNILLIILMLIIIFVIVFYYEHKIRKYKNKVHFYVARDKNGPLYLYIGKPERRIGSFLNSYGSYIKAISNESSFKDFGLNIKDYKDLKWEDEPLEVFLNMEDKI